ncbi:MAG: flagellar FlbD family protein [Desulfobacterales bacterium]|nr:MAG: flagellar FlbD family protein [Desulfobacterales bacterium]
MIKLTRLNDSVLVINVEKIQFLQATPDTVITLTNQDKILVKEPVEEVSQKILEYQRAVYAGHLSASRRMPLPDGPPVVHRFDPPGDLGRVAF